MFKSTFSLSFENLDLSKFKIFNTSKKGFCKHCYFQEFQDFQDLNGHWHALATAPPPMARWWCGRGNMPMVFLILKILEFLKIPTFWVCLFLDVLKILNLAKSWVSAEILKILKFLKIATFRGHLILDVLKILNLAKSRFSKEEGEAPFELFTSSEMVKSESNGSFEFLPLGSF